MNATQTTKRSFIQWALLPYKRCSDFRGTSGRAEFGWYCLFALLLNTALFIAGVAVFITTFNYPRGTELCIAPITGATFFSMVPIPALVIRRFHDANRSVLWAVVILGVLLSCLVFRSILVWLLTILGLPLIICPLWLLSTKPSENREKVYFVQTKTLVLLMVACLSLSFLPSAIDFISELRRPAVDGYQNAKFLITRDAFEQQLPCHTKWNNSDGQLSCKAFPFLGKDVPASAQFDNDHFVKLTIDLPLDMQEQVLGSLKKQFGRAFGYDDPRSSFHYMYYDRGNMMRMWGGLSNSISLDKDEQKSLHLTFRYSSTY